MNDMATLQIVALLGWLILAGSALASYKLSWRKALRMGLIWAAIFVGVAILFSIVGPGV